MKGDEQAEMIGCRKTQGVFAAVPSNKLVMNVFQGGKNNTLNIG